MGNAWTPPAGADLAKLMTLGEDIVEAWAAGTPGPTEEYYDTATATWFWNDTEASSDAANSDWKMGLAALAAAVYRFKAPRDIPFRKRFRDYAVDSVDAWFRDHQDAATGGIFRASASNVAADSGTATFMGLSNVAIVIACTGLRDRWATQILRALDYTTSRGELTWYTNGNFMLYKLVSYQLGAKVSGDDPARVAVVDALWDFTYTPSAADASKWRGCGFRDEGGGVGYFSEVATTSPGIDYRSANVFDAIYTQAQAAFAAVGYLTSGDPRFLSAAAACMRKILPIASVSTNQFTYTGGSRNAGSIARNVDAAIVPIAAFMAGMADIGARFDAYLNNGTQGMNVDYRRYLHQTNATMVRGFGLVVAAAIIAAHGVCLS